MQVRLQIVILAINPILNPRPTRITSPRAFPLIAVLVTIHPVGVIPVGITTPCTSQSTQVPTEENGMIALTVTLSVPISRFLIALPAIRTINPAWMISIQV